MLILVNRPTMLYFSRVMSPSTLQVDLTLEEAREILQKEEVSIFDDPESGDSITLKVLKVILTPGKRDQDRHYSELRVHPK